MAVSLAVSEIFSVKEWPDLEITQRHYHSIARVRFPIRHSAILYRLRDTATYWSKIAKFYTAPAV